MKKDSVAIIVLPATVGVIFAQTPKAKPVVRPSSLVVEKATWNSGWESILGITETDFRTLGFDVQSKEQSVQMFSYLVSSRPTSNCNKFYKDKDELKRVHVFVEGSPND